MRRADKRLEAIEAMIWRTGTRDALLVARIMNAVRDYDRAIQPVFRTAQATTASREGR